MLSLAVLRVSVFVAFSLYRTFGEVDISCFMCGGKEQGDSGPYAVCARAAAGLRSWAAGWLTPLCF